MLLRWPDDVPAVVLEREDDSPLHSAFFEEVLQIVRHLSFTEFDCPAFLKPVLQRLRELSLAPVVSLATLLLVAHGGDRSRCSRN